MALTAKQEKFAQLVASGSNQSEAYRASYPCIGWADETVWKRACELRKNGKVAGRISEIQAVTSEKWDWTREKAFATLRAKVLDNPDARPGDIVGAAKVLNDMTGLNSPQKHEITGSIAIQIVFCTPQGSDANG